MNAASVRQERTGFTIVELLIIIIVIAILASISIVAYRSIQNRAYDTAVQADISAIIKKLELVRVDLGHYPQSAAEFPDGFKLSKPSYDITLNNNAFYCLDKANDIYAFGLRSKSLKAYIINNGTFTVVATVSGHETCDVIGKDWVDDVTTFTKHGYDSATAAWKTDWSWTK